MTEDPQAEPDGSACLWNFEFLSLCAVSILAFCNIAIFYGFYGYLAELGIPPGWRGPLLALEPLTAFALRPFLGRFLTLTNGVRFMGIGLGMTATALVSYPLTTSVPVLAFVRVLHGAGFAAVVGGLLGLLTASLPKERSAQGFGLFSVTILLPYALMPPFVELLLPHLPGSGTVYALAAPLMLPALLLLPKLGKRARERACRQPRELQKIPDWSEVRHSLQHPGVLRLLIANLCLVSAHTIVFFFMRDVAVTLGTDNPGMFFTCANSATIALRAAGGRLLDRAKKGRLLFGSFLGLAALLPLFVLAGAPLILFGLAALYGLGMGVSMPLLNASMLQISPPRLRAFNANLLMLAVDAGVFAGPIVGGMLLAAGWTHAGLFTAAGGLMFSAALCVLPLARQLN
jgi:MFS family permease